MVRGFVLRIMCVALSAGILYPSSAASSAWTRLGGELYAESGISAYKAEDFFSAKGARTSGPSYRERSVWMYADYGLSDVWTAALQAEGKSLSVSQLGMRQESSGIGDVRLSVRRGFRPGSWAVALAAGVKVPSGYSETRIPPVGDGQVDVEMSGWLGRSWRSGYAQAGLGYRRRNGPYSDMIPYRMEIGMGGGRLLWRVAYSGVFNQADDAASTTSGRPPNVFDQEYADLSPGVFISLGRGFGVNAFYRRTVSGGNTAAGEGWGAAMVWKGKP